MHHGNCLRRLHKTVRYVWHQHGDPLSENCLGPLSTVGVNTCILTESNCHHLSLPLPKDKTSITIVIYWYVYVIYVHAPSFQALIYDGSLIELSVSHCVVVSIYMQAQGSRLFWTPSLVVIKTYQLGENIAETGFVSFVTERWHL